MRQFTFIVFLSMALIGVSVPAGAIPVTVTYTADNVILGTWYQSQTGAPVILSDPDDGSWQDWPLASTTTYDLAAGGTYHHVWQVENAGSFAGFLAQISFGDSLLRSSAAWEYSAYSPNQNESAPSFDDPSRQWDPVVELGENDNLRTTWYGYNGGFPIAGIAGDAQWIWAESQSVGALFIKTTFEIAAAPVPEPATLLLLGTGLAGLAAVGRRKFGKRGPAYTACHNDVPKEEPRHKGL